MEEKSTLGNFIKKKRKERNLSQKELADRLYVTESAVSKWERGISYPDITLVAGICEALGISEHELITASEDYKQAELVKQAKGFRNIFRAYSWVFYITYGISLLTCFIVNIAVEHRLSWFFIVLASEMVAFSLTSLPLLVKKHKGIVTLGAFYGSLNLLLFVCAVFTGGDWFGITFAAILFGMCVVFLPMVLRSIKLPESVGRHKTLLCMAVDTALLFMLVAAGCAYAGEAGSILPVAFPITFVSVILFWVYALILRYLPVHGLYKASILVFVSGIYSFFFNGWIVAVSYEKSMSMPLCNLADWSWQYIDGNVKLIILLFCTVTALLFVAGGIVHTVRGRGEAKAL